MIPSLVADDLRSALVEYLASSFALADDDVRDALCQFLTDPRDGIFRGPYLRVRTPFVAVDESWRSPLEWLPDGFRPYAHQAKAFERLSSAEGRTPSPTLVTTGTGSGKTECFLMPILDHCARERAAGRAGIKALILYPMNALASDQAGRLARTIHADPRLRGVRAGIYVGDEGRFSSMGEDNLIDRREAMRDDPPDIVLTNYKMLDFLMLRREDRNLWAMNDPDTLRYVVLDEFHTYDGAQGTDVAMLLRRLGASMRMAEPGRPLGSAVPIATSATLGSGTTSLAELREFAGKVFGVEFDDSSVIGEERQSIEAACGPVNYMLPIPDVADVLEFADDDLAAVAGLFCIATEEPPGAIDLADPVALGERLLVHPLTRAVLAAVGERPRTWDEAVAEVVSRAPNWGVTLMSEPVPVATALGRYLALLSFARRRQGGAIRPLFSVEVQLWVREVSRLLRAVDQRPSFRWRDSAAASPNDEPPPPPGTELPAVFCRKCGLSGWMAVQSELGDQLLVSSATVYEAALARSAQVRTLLRAHPDDPAAHWYESAARRVHARPDAAVDAVVAVHVTAGEDDAKANRCPACGESDTIRFLGLAVASLASVSINTLFGSDHVDEEERKLLAFTDSVQDASHRASFFGGRTHRINLRSLMARIVAERGEIALDELGDALWESAESPRDRFGLVPPDLLRHRDIRTVWTDASRPDGIALLRSRLGFEADLEFGLRARVGRTLELSRAVAAHVAIDNRDAVAALLGEHLRALDGEAAADSAGIGVFVRGLVERLRLRGGIAHPFLDPYVNDGGRQWWVWGGRPDGLPPFTPGQSRPTFATTAARGDFDSLTALSGTHTWTVDWSTRTLGVAPHVGRDLAAAAFRLLATETDAVIERTFGSARIYGLSRASIRVCDLPDDVADLPGGAGLRCALCGHRHGVPHQFAEAWFGSRCLRYRCAGQYEYDRPDPAGYYRRLYRRGRTRRVVTAEHTGLLDRHSREDLERAFKDGSAPDAPNVITATPTLEMGIDIGDLSAVMLTSVPRSAASYIQRVGRAGRASGNALIATFVRTDSHGLYYLADPEAMLAGEVRPPNCYLDATETLQRQYVAYLIDRIADLTIECPPIQPRIGLVMHDDLDEGGLLRRIINASILNPDHVEQFLTLFGTFLADVSRDRLRDFAASGIETTFKSAVQTWRSYSQELTRRRSRIGDAIKRLEDRGGRSGDDEAELASLRGQRRALRALLEDHRNEYTLSALERLGLLPNYTLIDDAATLTTTMWSRTDDGEYHVEKTDISRAAHLAVREFAPGNSFYANGHRHVIDALEIGSAEQPLYEMWRLCPDCGYAAIEVDHEPPQWCNRCGGSAIADAGARHQMLRLRTVLASSSEESARVYDETDERQRERYDTLLLTDVDPASISNAWQLTDRVFGAERAAVAHLRTLNLGFSDRRGERQAIAGRERHLTRFTVCRSCGAVRDVRDDRDGTRPERLHQGWCKVRSGSRAPQWDSILLFHELTTEVIRLLLPISMFEVEERLASFTGALLLGLRDDFGGNPDHLEIARADMPNPGGQGRRRFLVVFDRVPGGTGYLARLADPDRLRKIFEGARRIIARCPCQTEGRAACHRCLLGVVERSDYDLVRRDLALELLDDLLSAWTPEPIESVAAIDIAEVEESELERRFKTALTDWAGRHTADGITLQPVPGSGHRGAFDLRISRGGQTMRYRIDEQEGLGTTPSTTPDFLIRRMDGPGRDIAVYLDGYQYHASPEINNIADDAAKRAGIRASGRLVWNLTWDDVDAFHRAVVAESSPEPAPIRLLSGGALSAAQRVLHGTGGAADASIDTLNQNPVALLLDYLSRPDPKLWERLCLSAVGGAFAGADGANRAVRSDDLREAVGRALRAEEPQWSQPASTAPAVALGARYTTASDLPLVFLLDASNPNAERWTTIAVIPDDDDSVASPSHRRRWQDWLHWANVLQFADGDGRDAVITSTQGALAIELDDLWLIERTELDNRPEATSPIADRPSPVERVLDEAIEEELDYVTGDVRPLIEAAMRRGAPMFVAGHETADGVPLEAAWPDQRVAVLSDDDDPVTVDGWDIRSVSRWALEELVDRLMEHA